MNKNKISRIIILIALVSGALSILAHYNVLNIKQLSGYNFELLLIGFAGLLIARILRK